MYCNHRWVSCATSLEPANCGISSTARPVNRKMTPCHLQDSTQRHINRTGVFQKGRIVRKFPESYWAKAHDYQICSKTGPFHSCKMVCHTARSNKQRVARVYGREQQVSAGQNLQHACFTITNNVPETEDEVKLLPHMLGEDSNGMRILAQRFANGTFFAVYKFTKRTLLKFASWDAIF